MCSTPAELLAAIRALPDSGEGPVDPAEVTALRALVERAQAAYLARLAAFDRADGPLREGYARTWVWLRERGGALPAEARAEVWLARRLHTDQNRPMTATAEAVRSGRLTTGQAALIARALTRLPVDEAEHIEPTVAEQAAGLDPAATPRICQHLVTIGEDEDRLGRAERQRAARQLSMRPVGEMVHLDGMLPPDQAAPLMAAVDAYAQPVPPEPGGAEDGRTAAQRRADALCELARVALDRGAPVLGGLRPHLQMVIDVDALRRNSFAPGSPEPWRPGTPPAWGSAGWGSGNGGTPLTSEQVMEHSCDARVSWTALSRTPDSGRAASGGRPADRPGMPARVSGGTSGRAGGGRAGDGCGSGRPEEIWWAPDGAPLDPRLAELIRAQLPPALGGSVAQVVAVGRSTRLISPQLRRALNARDRGCIHPGCDRPPERCQAHHVRHWANGGTTELDNLVLACAHHHREWHHRRLRPERHPGHGWRLVADRQPANRWRVPPANPPGAAGTGGKPVGAGGRSAGTGDRAVAEGAGPGMPPGRGPLNRRVATATDTSS